MHEHSTPGKNPVTVYGQRNWDRVVDLAAADPNDQTARKRLSDALAGLVSELTPSHREVLASEYQKNGAMGRLHTWPLPPGIREGRAAQERWAAIVLLDCVDHIGDTLARDHDTRERLTWRANAMAYTRGAENNLRPNAPAEATLPPGPDLPPVGGKSYVPPVPRAE